VRAARLLSLLAFALAAASLWRALGVAMDQLAAPFDLVYETPNLRTIELLAAGRNIYAADIYAQPPFWLTIYTPAYHWLVSRLPASAENPFLTGRLVAMTCMLLAASTVFAVAKRAAWAAALGVGAFFLIHPVVSNTAFLKNDSLGLLLSALCVVILGETRRSPRWLALASLCAALAFFTKQSFVAAGLAGFVFLWFAERRRAIAFAALTGAWLTAGLALLRIAWGPDVWFCLFEAVRVPATWDHFRAVALQLVPQLALAVVLGLAIAEVARAASSDGVRSLTASPYPLYIAAAASVLLATLGKAGSATHYAFETALAALLWLAWSARRLTSRGALPRRAWAGVALLCGAAGADLAWTPLREISFTDPAARIRTRTALDAIASEIRRGGAPQPEILNLANARVSYPLPGRISISDPYLYALLWRSGQLDPAPVAAALRERAFDGVLTLRNGLAGGGDPDVERALRANYRVGRAFGAFVYHVRAAPCTVERPCRPLGSML
jgi:hypothetical protein